MLPVNIEVNVSFQISVFGEFPGGPLVRTLRFHCQGCASVPGWGTKIPQVCGVAKNNKNKRKTKQCQNKSVFSFSLDVYPGVELLDHVVVLLLVF